MPENKTWVMAGYDEKKGCYVIDLYQDGIKSFKCSGFPDKSGSQYTLYPRSCERLGAQWPFGSRPAKVSVYDIHASPPKGGDDRGKGKST